jgi:DsbC/DsbD-like thiol-disulfide interchange protein
MLGQMMKTLLIAAMFLPAATRAEEIYGSVDFLNGWRLSDGSYQTAIEFDLFKGWKTYWRVPGPAGIPPFFDWGGSTNIANVEIDWPTPEIFETYGLTSIGYKGQITLPVRITPNDPSVPINVELNMEFGVCSDICVPADARFNVRLGNQPKDGVPAIKAALKDAPLSARSGDVRSATCSLTPNGSGFDITADLKFGATLDSPRTTVIEYANPDIWIDIAKTNIEGANLTANATMEFYGDGMLTVDRSAIRITVLAENKAVEILGCPAS